MEAVRANKEHVVKYLLSRDAHANVHGKDGMSALFIAIENGNIEITRMLLDKGARLDHKVPAFDMTCLDLLYDETKNENGTEWYRQECVKTIENYYRG